MEYFDKISLQYKMGLIVELLVFGKKGRLFHTHDYRAVTGPCFEGKRCAWLVAVGCHPVIYPRDLTLNKTSLVLGSQSSALAHASLDGPVILIMICGA